MKILKHVLFFISLIFHLSITTLVHSTKYLELLGNIKVTYISGLIINSGFFIHDIFAWFLSKIGKLRYTTYFTKGDIKSKHFIEVIYRVIFRSIYRKKQRKPILLSKLIPRLNYFGDSFISSIKLSKIFASITIYITYIGLLYLAFKYLNYCLKTETFKYLNLGILKKKAVVLIIEKYYKFVEILNTLDLIKTFFSSKEIHKDLIDLFNFTYIKN